MSRRPRAPVVHRPGLHWILVASTVTISTMAGGCRNDDRVLVPNRVLDRPMDVALGCVVRRENDRVEALALNACAGANEIDCDKPDARQLVGFVTNSDRNEVAMFRRCDVNGLVDLDPEAPGYNFVPVGQRPEHITATEFSCRVVTANAGSCDLSAIDGRELAAYAVGLQPESPPSSLVSTIVPRRSDGEPLGARPSDILAVPSHLSLAGEEMDDMLGDGGGTGTGTGGDDGMFSDTEGDELVEGSYCSPSAPASVYVTFPACQLVAEVSLTTQRILQSRKIEQMPDGTIEIVDAGPDPECPIDCPAQFDGDVPDRESFDPEGFQPVSIALVEEPQGDAGPDTDPDEEVLSYTTLFVGGTGSDTIVEIPFEAGQWVPPDETNTLLLENPAGVQVIRVTPPAQVPPDSGDVHQFLYAVAGDGTTHVVDRHFESSSLGVECDTQVDPTVFDPSACHEIDPNAIGNAPDRRPFAVGPGIRAGLGATINDWTFQKVQSSDEVDLGPAGTLDPAGEGHAPFEQGLVGIGITSFGRVVYSTFGQFQDAQGTDLPGLDEMMNVEVDAHTLWPLTDPFSGEPSALPLVADVEPRRALPAEDQPTQVLAPSVRRIDLAYAVAPAGVDVSEEQDRIAAALGNPVNADELGTFDPALESSALYEKAVARVVARDYRQWASAAWALVWEGSIESTRSQTGRIECDNPGWEGGTCRNVGEDDARLVDESASYCDDGVLPGDKLVVLGCLSDDDCGIGQRCLREPSAPGDAAGICISARGYEESFEIYRQVCAPFISDPCGVPRREYLITRAYQDELWLQAMDIPRQSFLRTPDAPQEAPAAPIEEDIARLSCQLPIAQGQPGDGTQACDDDAQCIELNGDDFVCIDGRCRGVCQGGYPDCLECTGNADCADIVPGEQDPASEYVCVDGICRTACEGGSEACLLSPLPGPFCFSEFVPYVVRTHNSFIVQGGAGAPSFIADQVVADPSTGECQVDPSVSTLLTSRIRLGEDEEETFNHPDWGIPDCPNNDEALPTDPNPCRVVPMRADGLTNLFHRFAYGQVPVEAVRYTNPYISVVLDLVSLHALASEPPDMSDLYWPASFALFQRARIPRGYREEFSTQAGYAAINSLPEVQSVPATYPVRIVSGPEPGIAFVVDAGGRGGVTGVRGQVIRIFAGAAASQGQLADQDFRVR